MSAPRLFPLWEPTLDFEQRVHSLLPTCAPALAWVDNRADNYRFWKFALLYAENGILIRPAVLSAGEYRLILPRGAVLTDSGGGFTVSGGFIFQTDLFSHSGDTVTVAANGALSFSIDAPPAALGIGLEYAALSTCPVFGDRVPSVIRSPLLNTYNSLSFFCSFFPFFSQKTQFLLKNDQILSTCFSTVFGEPVRMKFPANFRFSLACRASRGTRHALYLTPDGTAQGVDDCLFMPGLSGTEYLRLTAPYSVIFSPGHPASWEPIPCRAAPTASRLTFGGGTYHCQPQESRYYRSDTPSNAGLRWYQELPGISAGNIELPAMPFSGALTDTESASRLEREYLYPTRRKLFEQIAANLKSLGAQGIEAATRHGLRVRIDAGSVVWLRLATTEEIRPQLAFTRVTPEFLADMTANNLFLPLNDPADLESLANTPYSVTAAHLDMAKRGGYGQTDLLKKLCDTAYLSRAELDAAVQSAGAAPDDILAAACDHFGVTADGWRFLCNPAIWSKFGTALVMKFTTTASLSELSHTPSLWSRTVGKERAEAFQKTVEELEQSLAETQNPELWEILYDANWCGVAIFNCAGDADNLPDELKFLANGIDKGKFGARFIAFPADMGKEQGSRICAMIDYRDEVHLRPENYTDYAFKVLRLSVCIRNGRVRDFGAKVELLINVLFGGAAFAYDSTGGNSVALSGSYQKDGDVGYYVFTLDRPEEYSVQNSLLAGLSIENAALLAGIDGCRFTFGGALKLYRFGETDLLSYNALPYGGLTIDMNLSVDGYTFRFDAAQLSLAPADGMMRENSFAEKFPVTPVKLLRRTDVTPQQSGYAKLWVQEVEQGDMGEDWYALLWEIRPGNLGNLSGVESSMELLTAWTPDPSREASAFPVFVGIRLGAAGSPDDWGFPLQGVMTLGFDAIELRRRVEKVGEAERVIYYFRFRNFALKLLGIRFPESNNDLFLISDETRRLGWYGAVEG